MSQLAEAISRNLAHTAKLTRPVAVFVGGTSGIGQGMAEAFNRHTKGNAHIVLVGRNKQAAESIISKMKSVAGDSSNGSYDFLPCDISLVSNVKLSAAHILAKHPKINFLIMTAGFLSTSGAETEEGNNKRLAVQYYGRWSFIHELLPALRAARDGNEDAKVFSVYGAGKGGRIDPNDFGLKKRGSTLVAFAGPTYNDLMCEDYALRNSGIVFAHGFPGTVRTNILKASESFFIRAMSTISPLVFAFTISQEDCGEYLWNGLHSSKADGAGSTGIPGSYRIGSRGDDLGVKGYFGTPELRQALWNHTVQQTNTVDA